MNKLRAAVSGFGQVAVKAHVPALLAREDTELVAIHDPAPERLYEAKRLLSDIRVYHDLLEMLETEVLDFLVIASPPKFHAISAELALEHGLHVLAEKPLCLNLNELKEIKDMAARSRVVVYCVDNWRYAPCFRTVFSLLKKGWLGDLHEISFTRLRPSPAGGPEGWRLAPATEGGGILIDHGWHVLYLANWFMGEERPLSVAARFEPAGSDGGEQVVDLKLCFPQKRCAYAHLSWRASARKTLTVFRCSKGFIEIDGNALKLVTKTGQHMRFTFRDDWDDSYHAKWFVPVLANFLGLVKGVENGAEPPSQLDEVLSLLMTILAARKSALSYGEEVAVEGIERA